MSEPYARFEGTNFFKKRTTLTSFWEPKTVSPYTAKNRKFLGSQWLQKRYFIVMLEVTKNGRGNKIDKNQIYDRYVDFREFRNVCCDQAADGL